jgi:hypothetical protein
MAAARCPSQQRTMPAASTSQTHLTQSGTRCGQMIRMTRSLIQGRQQRYARPVMSRIQRLSWGGPPLGDSLFSAELIAALLCFRVFVAT